MEHISRIAVGYDASPEAEQALEWAIDRAKHRNATLDIIRAVHADLSVSALESANETKGGAGRGPLTGPGIDRAVATLGEDRVITRLAAGSASRVLVDVSHNVDEVVVGTRGRGAIAAGFMGSTAYAVAAHAHCPVVVVRTGADAHAAAPGPERPVVVGVEDPSVAGAALEHAGALAQSYDAPLRLVRVRQPVATGAISAEAFVYEPDLVESLAEADTEVMGNAKAFVTGKFPSVKVEQVFADGTAASALVDHAQNAGALVVGSRGRGGFKGLMLGSVSHAVIHLATCPVVVVR